MFDFHSFEILKKFKKGKKEKRKEGKKEGRKVKKIGRDLNQNREY